ncbi:MAG: AMP-binding protein [Xanthobacteraceae bacterium]|nr:AMP-binding protein [Xanthobacteraceae bacterium]
MERERQRDDLILADLVALRAETQPDLDVLTFVGVGADGALTEQVRTYAQLWENGNRVAAALAEAGTIDGAKFAIMMRNHPAFVEAMVGASIAGAVFVPIDPRAQGEKLAFMLDFAECRGLIVGDYALDAVRAVRDRLPRLEWIWVLETGEKTAPLAGARTLGEVLGSDRPRLAPRVTSPDQPQQLLFTSGTTGDPKAIVAPYRRFGEAARLGALFGLAPGDRPYTGLSLTHANAQMVTLASALYFGYRAVISERFTKSRLLDIARKYGCTVFTLLGGMATAVYSEPRRPDDADTPFRLVISAGMPAALWETFAKRFGVSILEFYGAAEGGLCINLPGQGPVGSVGRPPPNLELKIFDDGGRECAPGEPGEICFRSLAGSPLAVDYLKDRAASREKVTDGWLRMGDIGHVDADGWLFFHHRKGSAIRRNGDFINPAVIEKLLAEHPQVQDVFVYGCPAASGAPGEKDVVAAIVPVDRSTFDPAAIFRDCRAGLEPNSVPVVLQVVEAIPKTASEKPQERFLLKDLLAGAGWLVHATDPQQLQPAK